MFLPFGIIFFTLFRITVYHYKNLDLITKEDKQRLIDGFVNSIYLYDDRYVITFNYKNKSKTVTFEEIERSSLTSKGSPSANKSEHLCSGLFFILLSVFFKYFPRSEFLIRFCGLPDRQAVFIATDDYSDSLKIVLSAPMRGES